MTGTPVNGAPMTGGQTTGGPTVRTADTADLADTAGRSRRRVRAVVFDLDDTLVPQQAWLAGAWAAVAAAGAELGRALGIAVDESELLQALVADAAGGTARGGIIDRAVTAVAPELPVPPLVDAFRSFRAPSLAPYAGVVDALDRCRAAVPVGLVTDGDPGIQRAKLAAAGLEGTFDAIVLSDELGREHRKPHPLPFRTVVAALGIAPGDAAYVGDRPDKDIVGAAAVGMVAVRVRTGEYADAPDDVVPDADLPGAAEAVAWLLDEMVVGR